MSDDFDIITSIRSDQILRNSEQNVAYAQTSNDSERQFYLLSLHRDRLITACEAFGRSCQNIKGPAGLVNLRRQLQGQLLTYSGSYDYGEPLKLRLTITKQGYFYVTANYVPAVPKEVLFPKDLNNILALTDAVYCIFVSPERISTSLFTQHKTTNRSHYDQQRALLPPALLVDKQAGILQEVLVVNYAGEIMEGTFTTPYFYRKGVWITPSVACGGHQGVARRWALAAGLCNEGVIMTEEIVIGENVILSNGVRGFGWGTVMKFENEVGIKGAKGTEEQEASEEGVFSH